MVNDIDESKLILLIIMYNILYYIETTGATNNEYKISSLQQYSIINDPSTQHERFKTSSTTV